MIVLADGVFDPLHSGHLAYLNYAKTLGSVVVQVSPQRKRVELLSWGCRLQVVSQLGFEVASFPTTAAALNAIKPEIYVKGHDWAEKGIPADEAAFCTANGVKVVYAPPDAHAASSTGLLQSWAATTAVAGVDELNAKAAAQTAVPWDADANGYTLERRREIEGRHPDILAELCQGMSVLDYGCGPGHLVTMLKERGVNVWGYDPVFQPGPFNCANVVICREVLEHVPVREWGDVLHGVFSLARRYVYITTRFTANPRHPFDLTNEADVDPSHITCLPQSFVRALCVTMGGRRCREWEEKLDWQHKGRVLVYEVGR